MNGVTHGDALRMLAADATRTEASLREHIAIALSQNQFDALVSFAFNVGAGAFAGSTLLRLLNAGDIAAASDQLLGWNKITVGGALIADPGLTRRRAADRALFVDSVYAA